MQTMLEYITLNYTWIIVGSIIILLAIIGYYADKTNFGQGKTKENLNNVNKNILEGKRMEDLLDENKDKTIIQKESPSSQNIPLNNNESINTVNTNINISNGNNVVVQNIPMNNDITNSLSDSNIVFQNTESLNSEIDSLGKSEKEFENFNKEFNKLLPKKEIIDDDLLDNIDNLSLDKTQKINISDIPDLDDVELPEIKSLKSEEEDIWKF